MYWLLNVCRLFVEKIYGLPKKTQTKIIILLILIPLLFTAISEFQIITQTGLEPAKPPEVSFEDFLQSAGPLWMQLALLVLPLMEIPLVLFAWKTLNQEPLDYRSVLKQSIRVLPMFILIGILFTSLVVLLSFAFLIPGIIAAIYYEFTFQIVILEPDARNIKNIFNKSAAIVKGNFRLIFILFLITIFIVSPESPVIKIPLSIASIIFQAFTLTVTYTILTKNPQESADSSAEV